MLKKTFIKFNSLWPTLLNLCEGFSCEVHYNRSVPFMGNNDEFQNSDSARSGDCRFFR
jgi:hypothetical protein